MKQEERFNNILNQCLDRIIKGETVEQCLRDYPEQAAELKPLLQTALTARTASAVQPSSEFKARARYEFQAALNDMKTKKADRKAGREASPWTRWRWQWQSAWSIALVALIIIVFGGGGTIVAARGSMPDNPLYSVKIFTENVQLAFAFSDTGKTELNARFADERAQEIVYAAANGSAPEVQSIASRMNSNMVNITDLSNNSLVQASKNNKAALNNAQNNAAQPAAPAGVGSGNQASAATAGDVSTATAAPPRAMAPDAGNTSTASVQATESTQAPAPVTAEPPAPAITVAPALPPEVNIPVTAPGPATGAKGSEVTVTAPEITVYEPENSAEGSEGTPRLRATGALQHSYGLSGQLDMRQIIINNYSIVQARLAAALEVASAEVRPVIRRAMAQAQEEYEKALSNLDQADFLNSSNMR